MMRRFAAVVLVIGASALAVRPAGAASPVARHPRPFTGTTSYTFTTDGCSFVHQVYDGTFRARRHSHASFHLEGCVTLGSPFPYLGTFTVHTRRGTLSGTVAGTIQADVLPCASFDFTLTVQSGTRHFRRTSGTIDVQGSWCGRGTPATNDPTSGTITTALTG